MDIGKLVKQKLAEDPEQAADGSPAAKSAAKTPVNLDLLRNKTLYTVEVTVKAGRMSTRLNAADIGLSTDVIKELSQIATGGYSARLSKLQNTALNKLQSMKKVLYERFTMFSEPFRFVVDSDLPEAVKALEEMKEEAKRYRHLLYEQYEQEMSEFLMSIEQILDKAGIEPDRRAIALEQYAKDYPKRNDLMTQSLQLIIEGPARLNGLMDQLTHDAEFANKEKERLEAELAKAQKEHELAEVRNKIAENQQAWDSIRRSQLEYGEMLAKAVNGAQERAIDETFNSMAELVDRCAVIEPGHLDGFVTKTWEGSFERLETLAQFDPLIRNIVDHAKEIRDIFSTKNPPAPDAIQSKLQQFQEFMSLMVQGKQGEGASKLTNCLNHDRDYKELVSTLEKLEANPDAEVLRSIQAKCEGVVQFFRYRQKSLEKKFEAARKADLVARGIEKPDAEKGPFDLEVGF